MGSLCPIFQRCKPCTTFSAMQAGRPRCLFSTLQAGSTGNDSAMQAGRPRYLGDGASRLPKYIFIDASRVPQVPCWRCLPSSTSSAMQAGRPRSLFNDVGPMLSDASRAPHAQGRKPGAPGTCLTMLAPCSATQAGRHIFSDASRAPQVHLLTMFAGSPGTISAMQAGRPKYIFDDASRVPQAPF